MADYASLQSHTKTQRDEQTDENLKKDDLIFDSLLEEQTL
jgi:hypothetical protein